MVLHISCGASQKGLKIHSFEPSCNGKWVPSLQGFIFHWTVLILQGNHLEIVFHRSKKEMVREGHGLVMTTITLHRFENVYDRSRWLRVNSHRNLYPPAMGGIPWNYYWKIHRRRFHFMFLANLCQLFSQVLHIYKAQMLNLLMKTILWFWIHPVASFELEKLYHISSSKWLAQCPSHGWLLTSQQQQSLQSLLWFAFPSWAWWQGSKFQELCCWSH